MELVQRNCQQLDHQHPPKIDEGEQQQPQKELDEENPWADNYNDPDALKTSQEEEYHDSRENLAPSDYDDLDRYDDDDEENNDYIYNDMAIFCHAIDEPQFVDFFKTHKVTLGQLLDFDDQDLRDCGIELVGDRKKILDSIAQIHSEKWVPSSLQDVTSKTLLSSPGIYITINDINKHLEFIGITLRYIRRQVQINPQILELGKDYVGVSKISSELSDLIKTSNATHQQVEHLNKFIDRKYLNDKAMQPANHIDDNYILFSKIKQKQAKLLSILTAGLSVAFVCMTINMSRKLW